MAKKGTSKKKKTNKRNSKRNNTNLIIVITIGIACVGMVLVTKALNNKSEETNGTVGPTSAVEATKAPEPSVTPQVTEEPEATLTPAPTQEATPTAPQENQISETEASGLVKEAIADDKYSIELINDKVSIDGKEYYEYHVSLDKAVIGPSIIVLKEDGSLYYYDQTGTITAFTKFPLDKVESAGNEENTVTKEAAIEKVAKFSRAALGLEKDLKEYTIEVDDWTTIVKGESCYCLNVFEEIDGRRQLVGVYYVSVDGEHVYWLNEEEQDFVEIRE